MVDQVTFPPSIGGSGKTYTNDANPETGMFGGGHRTNFFPMLSDTVAAAGYVAQYAQKIDGAKDDADRAENARGYVEAVAGGVENNIVAKYKHSAVIDMDFERGEYAFDNGELTRTTDFSAIGNYTRSTPVFLPGPTGAKRSIGVDKLPRQWLANGDVGAAFLPKRTNFVARSYTPWLSPWSSSTTGYFNDQKTNERVPGVGVVSVAHYGPGVGVSSFSTSVSRQVVNLGAGIYCISAIFKSVGNVAEPTVRTMHRAVGAGSGVGGSLLGNLYSEGGVRGRSASMGDGSFGLTEILYCRPIGNGYYEYAERMELLTATDVELRFFPYDGGSAYVGDGTTGLYRTAVQVEKAAWPSPAIDTQASATSRLISQAEILKAAGALAFAELTLFVDVTIDQFSMQDHSDSTQGILSLSAGATSNFISISTRSDSSRLRCLLNGIGGESSEILDVFISSSSTFGRRHRIALSVKNGLQVGCANGLTPIYSESPVSSEFFKDWDRLVLMGYYRSFNRRSFGTLHNVMLLPTALTGAELQELTQL